MNEQLVSLAAQVLTALIIAGLGLLLRSWAKRADFEQRLKLLSMGSQLAYGVVNELSRRTANKVDDKVALGLAEVNAFLAKQGQAALTPDEASVVKTMFDAQHGIESKVLAAANP